MSLSPRNPGRPRLSAVLPAVLAAALITLSACTTGAQQGPSANDPNYVSGSVGTTAFKAGQRPIAPRVSGATLTGQRLSLSGFRGKVVVLNFWASWCAPCRSEAPALAQLSKAYRAKGVQFIGVNIKDPGQANGKAYERNFAITYPSWYDPAAQILLAFRKTVPPSAIPSTLVIDRTGHIAARTIGADTYSGLKALLDSLTTQTAAAGKSG